MFKKLFGTSDHKDRTILIEKAQTAKQEGATHVLQNEKRPMEAGQSVTFYRHRAGNVEWALMEYVGGKEVYFWVVDPKKWNEKGPSKPFWIPLEENVIPGHAKPIDNVIANGIL